MGLVESVECGMWNVECGKSGVTKIRKYNTVLELV